MISKPSSDLAPLPISLVGKPWVEGREGVQCAQNKMRQRPSSSLPFPPSSPTSRRRNQEPGGGVSEARGACRARRSSPSQGWETRTPIADETPLDAQDNSETPPFLVCVCECARWCGEMGVSNGCAGLPRVHVSLALIRRRMPCTLCVCQQP